MDFHSVISQLKVLDEEMLSIPIKNISNEDLKSHLLWLKLRE